MKVKEAINFCNSCNKQINILKIILVHKTKLTMKTNYKGDEAPMPDDGVRPTFTERPVIKQLDDDKSGGRIMFECRCVGDPKPEVEWSV